MLILISGPYRSGTDDDPDRMAANLRRLEEPSWTLFQAGHIPMIGEWVALPVWKTAGGQRLGDEFYERIFYPTAERLLQVCEAVPASACPATFGTGRGRLGELAHPQGATVVVSSAAAGFCRSPLRRFSRSR